MVQVEAPAKVNLFLEVLARRGDGFHEVETLVVPIDRWDTLQLTADPGGEIRVHCRWADGLQPGDAEAEAPTASGLRAVWDDLPQGQDNLVFRALDWLRRAADIRDGARVRLMKRIPASAGLGGASSDAAAALVAANAAWGLGWNLDQLGEVGAQIGSDVPLFLCGKACICRGRGERIEPLAAFPRLHLVIVRPPEGLGTAAVYRRVETVEQPRQVGSLLEAARRGDGGSIGRLLFNRLQPAARSLSQWVGRLEAVFGRLDVWGHQMSGSGSSYFGLCRHAGHARRLAARLRSEGWSSAFCAATEAAAFRSD